MTDLGKRYFAGTGCHSSERSDTIFLYMLKTLVREMNPMSWLFMSTTGR